MFISCFVVVYVRFMIKLIGFKYIFLYVRFLLQVVFLKMLFMYFVILDVVRFLFLQFMVRSINRNMIYQIIFLIMDFICFFFICSLCVIFNFVLLGGLLLISCFSFCWVLRFRFFVVLCNYFLLFVRVFVFVKEFCLVLLGFLMRIVKKVVNVKILIGWLRSMFCRNDIDIDMSYWVDFLGLNFILYIMINDVDVQVVIKVRLYVM